MQIYRYTLCEWDGRLIVASSRGGAKDVELNYGEETFCVRRYGVGVEMDKDVRS